MSRHGAPVRSTQSTAFTINRLSVAGRAFLPRSAGRHGAIEAHTSSLSSNRLRIYRMEHISIWMERGFVDYADTP